MSGPIVLPNGYTLSASQRKRMNWGDAEVGNAWFDQLPETIHHWCDRWQLTLDSAMPELSMNLVFFATSPLVGECVLKISPPHWEVTAELEALRIADRAGQITLLAADYQSAGSLQKRIRPGRMLRKAMEAGEINDVQATEIAGNLMRSYWLEIPENPKLTTMDRWLKDLFAYAIDHQDGSGRIPVAHINAAVEHAERLLAAPTHQVLLHGDLHHDNILEDDTHGWAIIDPKGLIGEPGFDITALMFNPIGWEQWNDHEAITNRRLDQLSEILGIERYRLWQWTLVFSSLTDVWNLQGDPNCDLFAQRIAEMLLAMPEAKR